MPGSSFHAGQQGREQPNPSGTATPQRLPAVELLAVLCRTRGEPALEARFACEIQEVVDASKIGFLFFPSLLCVCVCLNYATNCVAEIYILLDS